MTITLAETDAAIACCYPVLAQLRQHIAEAAFVARVRRQQAGGYRLAAVESGGAVCAVGGFRFFECLAWGQICYVDDLVTTDGARSRGHGAALLTWIGARAREAGCAQLHLDSGVQRFAAHRFYLTQRMDIVAHHFGLIFPPAAP